MQIVHTHPAELEPPITVTTFDRRRLLMLIDLLRTRAVDVARLDALEDELDRADAVEPRQVPADVVTMNSRVELVDAVSEERQTITVVFPGAVDVAAGKVSVLAPAGMALLGARVGEHVAWMTPAGRRVVTVARIAFQPEAAGIFDL